jgi:hypothetical protein
MYDEPTMDVQEIKDTVKKPLFPPAKKDFSDLYIEQDEDVISDDIDDIGNENSQEILIILAKPKPQLTMPQFTKKKSLLDLSKPNSSLNSTFSKSTNQKKMTDFIDEDDNEFMKDTDKEFRAEMEVDNIVT